MALPPYLAEKLKAIPMDPTVLATDLELSYLLSFTNNRMSHDSIYLYPRESYQSPLENYQFADFQDKAYDQLLEDTRKNYKSKNKQVAKGIRCGFKQFYARVAANTSATALKFMMREKPQGEKKLELPKEDEEEYRIQKLKGNNPVKWPETTKEFVKDINALPWHVFSSDSETMFFDFVESVKNAIIQLCQKPKVVDGKLQDSYKQNLVSEIQALLGVVLRTNSQSFILEQLKFLANLKKYIQLDEANEAYLCQKIKAAFEKFFQGIPQESTQKYHCPGKLWDLDPFVIMKKIHFQKYPGLAYYSIATDGNYLYFYVSAVNGGIFKIGTGNGGTKAGKVYLERQIHFPIGTKVDQVNWVYLKGKLYLKTSSKDPWILDIISPLTLKKEGSVQLFCPSLFGHPSLANINKNTPLLTDGESLFVLGSRIKICKAQGNQKDQPEPKQDKSQEKALDEKRQLLEKKKVMKKKAGKKGQQSENPNPPPEEPKNQNFQKILEIVLFQFSVDLNREYKDEGINQSDVEELYDSFSGYFSKNECRRALVLNNFDIADTCQWLFNEGEKQKDKNIKILDPIGHVILSESEITSNFQEKAIKAPTELVCKEGSILMIHNVYQSIWTMDKKEITCYSETGLKVFSKNMKDFHRHQDSKCFTTLLKVSEAKFPRNPECNIIYDPYSFMFYTFGWPPEGHYFPSTVLVSKDKKHELALQEKKQKVGIKSLGSLNEIQKFALHNMTSIDRVSLKSKYRFNDWLWTYGQKVIEISNEMNANDSDKKRLSNKRTKIMTKMNKINDIEKEYEKNKAIFAKNQKVIKQIVKIYPFEAEGTSKSYVLINDAFKNLPESPQDVCLYVNCIRNWLRNCSTISDSDVRTTLLDIGDKLMMLKEKSVQKNRNLINKILIEEFYLFFPTLEKQIKYIISMNEKELDAFVKSQWKNSKKQKESIVYQLTKKQLLVQKYETNKCNFSEVFKNQQNVSVNDIYKVELLGNLLLSDILQTKKEKLIVKGKYNEDARKDFFAYVQDQMLESEAGQNFVEFLFLTSLKMLKTNTKDSQLYFKYETQLFVEVLKLFERTFSKVKTTQLYSMLPVLLMVVEVYHGSLISIHPNQQIINSFLKIIEYIQRPQLNEVHNLVRDCEYEGISPITQKIYETSHPLERGKSYNFPPRKFNNASIIMLDLDKRCVTDHNNDNLSLQIIHEEAAVGNNIVINDGVFSSNVRLSGNIDTKKISMLLANSCTIDITSSGHVKDTQSLHRFGFKFGLRPIFTGRNQVIGDNKNKIVSLFGNIQNFESYYNTLKFLAVATSSSIENYLQLESETSQPKIEELLRSKIFKEGFQQSALKDSKNSMNPIETINKFIQKSEYQSADKTLLKNTQQQYWSISEKKQEKEKQEKADLWNFDGIPAYIKTYLQQIKEFKGNFIDVFTEARELAKEKGVYAQMMRKPIMKQNKTLWLQGQAILFLTILKHSGLLHLNLKFSIEYIKQNLKAFEDARDGIYNSFLSRIQYVKEWRDLIETYTLKDVEVAEQKKEEAEVKKPDPVSSSKPIVAKRARGPGRTIKIPEKKEEKKQVLKKEKIQQKPQKKYMNRNEFQGKVRERLSNESLIKGICNIRKIKYDDHYDIATRIIEELIKAAQEPLDPEEKAYSDPIEHLIQCCLFLLTFKSPSTKESLSQNENIVPVGMMRSLSEGSRNCDTNKVNIFREWLENWKNWKGFKKQGNVSLQFPVEEIVKYINSWRDLRQIKQAIERRSLKCQNRIEFYTHFNQLLKLFSQSKIVKYVVGSEILNLSKEHSSDLESISRSKLSELQEIYENFRDSVKIAETALMNELPLTLEGLQKMMKEGGTTFLQKLKLLFHSLFMLECQNPKIDLNVLLYTLCFKYLSSKSEELCYISNALIQRGFICQHSNEQIVNCLMREVGNSSVSFKRWKDFFFIERVLFLLRKLEINVRKNSPANADAQIKIAQTLFYILYHIEVPLIARLSFKILNKLKISMKQGIKTAFEYEYKLYKSNMKNELQLKETFKLSRNNRNNITLLCSKINNIFDTKHANELALKFDEPKEEIEEYEKYNVILNLHQEEDLYWMIKVLYYIDELEIKKGEKTLPQIKDFDEYLLLKNKKKEGEKKEQKENPENQKDRNIFRQIQKNQRIISNLPKYSKVDSQLEKELPVGWFFNYCDIFADPLEKVGSLHFKKQKNAALPVPPNNQKNPRANRNNQNNNQNPKKGWNTPILTKLSKKYQEFSTKPPEEPKAEDSADAKAEYIKAKNIFNRIRRYFAEIVQMIDNFSRNGCYVLREDIPKVRMNQLCQLVVSGSMNRLKDIEIDLKNNDIKNRLIINEFVPNFNSRLKITLIKSRNYAYFNNLLTYQNTLLSRADNQQISYYPLLGRKELAMEDSKAFMPYQKFIAFDQSAEDEPDIQFGKQWIESNFSRMKKKYEKVYLNDYPNQTFYISQGGIESGTKDNVLIPADQGTLTQQTTPLEKIFTHPKHQEESEYEETQLPEQLVEKINKIIDRGSIDISKKEDIREYLLLTFYLKKLTSFNLEYGDTALYKQFAKKLFKFTQHLHSFKELSVYEQECQKLIIKLIDNEHQKLHIFGTYMHDDEFDGEVQEYHVPVRLQKINSKNQVKQQSLQTHAGPKSKYLLSSQPPQIEQNKLLKYWQKNILPKIHEFVRTTLKPLQIEDFWEQMRRPLRVQQHGQAKRVAYIICDNKLPAGAVLPDSSHNWDSLELDQIFVGQNVLIKLPKTKTDFCTPLLGWGNQQQRLGKVVFVDMKNSSVLVRYRVQELGLFSYTWVPVNSLMAVEKEVMHISTKSIYEQLNKSLQGMIYMYAKECLTKLATLVSDLDNIKLIRETILDMLIKNPISGCFDYPKPKWSMRGIFEKMLVEKNYAVIDILEKQFCSIKGMDLNMNSEKMTELNRFDDAKALIISFKKDAKLAACSGVRFYDDKFGYNEIAHVYTAKSERTDIQPLEFKGPNIYCKYYTNKECLPILEQSNYKIHPIDATIFAVDDMWTIGCYIGEVVCEIAWNKGQSHYLEVLKRLNVLFLKWLTKKSVSVLCSYLAKLISKIALTIVYICERNKVDIKIQTLGATVDQVKDVITWIGYINEEESKDKIALYSNLLQNLSEMVASLLIKVTTNIPNIPEHIKASMDLMRIFKEIDSFSKTKKISLFQPNPPANYQWERILQISNIPDYMSQELISAKIKEIVETNKGKILCPKLDIFQKNGSCYILVDGWDITELIEEDVVEKMEQEVQQQREDQMGDGGGLLEWDCPFCTYHNPGDANNCQMCESPAPVAAKQEDVYDQVQATDLKKAEKKLKQKEGKRFEEVKIQILNFFDHQYKVLCEKVQKKNNEAEENAKNKDNKKNKKGGKEEVAEVKQVPKKPEIKLETGSTVFQKPEIDQFLKARIEYFPQQLQKMVAEEETYIGKFKKLLNLGYDLWGDNTSNQNAILIPFNYLYMLMDYVQTQICKGSSSVLSYSQDSIRILSQIPLFDHKFSEEPVNYNAENDMGVRAKYKKLAEFKSYNIRYSWKFVKELNLAASKCLQLINMDFKYDKERNNSSPVFNDCLGYKLKYYRNLIMGVIKLELFQKIMQKTSVNRENNEVPNITLERMKIREEKDRPGIVTPKEKEDYLFTKSHEQFLKKSPAFLRPFKPKGTDPYVSFTVTFKGQNVMGEAGPYRQFFTDIGRELDPSTAMGLFIPSPNNRNQSGDFKSQWVINPKANSTYHFSLFEYIGLLMGCCFRTGSHLTLDLPTMFWKSLTHDEITDQDLDEIDSQLTSFISMLQKCPSKEDFEEAMEYTNGDELTWTYRGFDDEVHEMFHNGKNTKVEFEELPKYIQMLKLKKINQFKLQVKRILKGLSDLIPLPYLHCLSGDELKLIICGRPKVDVDLLKKHTKYSGGLNEESRRIKYFWEIMKELSQTDRLKIIKFCWGQERLPMNSEEYERNNIRFMIKPMVAKAKNQDDVCPKADTCFFNIELPDYSTKTKMKDMILLAVNMDSTSINADENIYNEENGLMNEINTYGEEDYEEGGVGAEDW